DSVMEEATFLTRFATKVTVVHRRDELRASAIMVGRAQRDPKIDFAWNSTVSAIGGEKSVESITLTDTITGESREVPMQ
ncbi:FAD-dependent oxidoreductase, partial [Klebsiella pneumoniae]|nr:FAD-dependent oxidoreductase [Klebsiella pneumoniae]